GARAQLWPGWADRVEASWIGLHSDSVLSATLNSLIQTNTSSVIFAFPQIIRKKIARPADPSTQRHLQTEEHNGSRWHQKNSEHLDVEVEEIMQTAVSVRGSDSDQDSEEGRPVTAGQHVSTPAPVPSKPKYKALGTPLPEGHGSTRKKTPGDQTPSSAPKKATPPKPSESTKSSDSSKHCISASKFRKTLSITKKPASEQKRAGYTEEHGLSKTLKESHKTTEEDSQIQPILEVMN
ncbi:hypothetical protein NDU88_001700, partial [Pleurodeles waltl]